LFPEEKKVLPFFVMKKKYKYFFPFCNEDKTKAAHFLSKPSGMLLSFIIIIVVVVVVVVTIFFVVAFAVFVIFYPGVNIKFPNAWKNIHYQEMKKRFYRDTIFLLAVLYSELKIENTCI